MAGIPILAWEAPPLSNNIYASEIMNHPVVTLKTVENVGHIVELLKCVTFNGFPVVDPPSSDQVTFKLHCSKHFVTSIFIYRSFFVLPQTEINSYGRFRGLILRSQLIVLLQNKIFNEHAEYWEKSLSLKLFRDEYPRYPTIDQVTITDEEKTYTIDLRTFMNPSPYTLQHVSVFATNLFINYRVSEMISMNCLLFSLQHCPEHLGYSEAWVFDICQY